MDLKDFFKEYPKVAIAFSGGCDSAYLSYAALKYAKEVRAYYVKTAFQPEFEYEDALRFAKEYSLDVCVIEYDILKEENVCANPSNRCYFCKQKIFTLIKQQAAKDGFEVLLDGSNASDDDADRPGMKALSELSVLSPLRLCELTKSDIRRLSKEAGLFTWDKPAYACLATRVLTGEKITADILNITEKAEEYMKTLGFSDFRVRYREGNALIQLTREQFGLYEKERPKIEEKLGEYYKDIILDRTPRQKSVLNILK